VHPLIPWFEAPQIAIPIQSMKDPPAIHAFGVLVLIGFVAGTWIATQRAEKFGLDGEPINRLVGWLVLGTFIGGHVGNELMYEPEKVWRDPLILLRLWDGLSSYGGFIACVPITFLFFKYEKLPMWRYADCIAYGMTVGWFFGRMGCFTAHDHPGSPTNFWLGVYGICAGNPDKSVACHDTGLYEALWAGAMFGLFALLDTRPRPSGFYVAMLGLCYGPVRVFLDSLRPASTDTQYFGFTPAQYLSMLVTVLCAALLVQRYRVGEIVEPAPVKSSTA
jgi:phosphatidylglycerol:prolipoprotein diacylglycerol transferase